MYLQNDKRLLPAIQQVGCLYLSMMRILELMSGREMAIEDVNFIWRMSKQSGYIDSGNNMKQMDDVFRLAKRTLVLDKLAFSVGLIEQDKTTFWDWTKNNQELHDYKYMIENYITYGVEGNHFVLCDSRRNVLFDSYSFKPYKSEHIGRYHLINHY